MGLHSFVKYHAGIKSGLIGIFRQTESYTLPITDKSKVY